LQEYLADHEISRAFQLGWAGKKNGELLALADEAGFEILVTTDQNLLHQQDLSARKMAVFVLGRGNWPEIKPHAPQIAAEINAVKRPGVYFFAIEPGKE